jgi:hypothetical protein
VAGGEERVPRLEEVRESSAHCRDRKRQDIGRLRGAPSTGSEAVERKSDFRRIAKFRSSGFLKNSIF